jgi:ABC-type glycerol-3-phosphate transport system substrate-binding protein
MAKRALVLLTSLIIVLSGCAGSAERQIVRLWSQTPTILPFVDRYNTAQNNYKIEVTYIPSPADEILIAQEVPDLVLSERLSAPRCAAKLEGLGPLLNQTGLDPQVFYQRLLQAHQYNGAAVALPFSFNLPVIVFNRDLFSQDLPNDLSLEQLMSLGQKYTKIEKGRVKALGFSPLWGREFLFHTATLFDVDFHAGADQKLSWDETALDNWLHYLVGWTDDVNGGFEAESDFIRTYLYEPPYQLVSSQPSASRRIAFYQALAADYFRIPAEKRSLLAMAWLSRSQKIPADEAVLFFGVPKGVRNRPGAYDFLTWVFAPQNQRVVLKDNAAYNPGSFGIGGGFSALPQVNESFLPEVYPYLRGRIPDASRLIFPSPLPDTWEKTKTEVILPWIYDHFLHKKGLSSLQKLVP